MRSVSTSTMRTDNHYTIQPGTDNDQVKHVEKQPEALATQQHSQFARQATQNAAGIARNLSGNQAHGGVQRNSGGGGMLRFQLHQQLDQAKNTTMDSTADAGRATYHQVSLTPLEQRLMPDSLQLGYYTVSNGPHFKAVDGSAKLPMGMQPEQFEQLLTTFSQDEQLQNAQSMALYGSRVHFEAGVKPKAGSDLDTMVFFDEATSASKQRAFLGLELDESFKPLNERLGFEMAEEIPSFGTLSQVLDPAYTKQRLFSHVSAADEQRAWQQLCAQEVDNAQIERNDLKQQFGQVDNALFSKETLFLIRAPFADDTVSKLQASGYQNIIIVE